MEAIASNLRASAESPTRYATFYKEHVGQVHRYFARRVFDQDAALDLTAETFAQAYVSRGRFRGQTDGEAVAWLFGIATRQLALFLRRKRVEKRALERLGIEVPELDDDDRTRLEELSGLSELRSAVRRGLGELSDAQRQAVQLRVVDELPYREVAERLSISEGAARVRVMRALRALGVLLDPSKAAKETT